MDSTTRGRFLDGTIDGRARLMVLLAVVLLAVTYVLPLWNLTMFAPQYPEGLRLVRTSRKSTS